MLDAALVFFTQYTYILLMAWQSLNVNHDHRVAAATTSTLLGTIGFYMTGVVSSHRGEAGSLVWYAYVLSGPCGVLTSMWFFKFYRGKK